MNVLKLNWVKILTRVVCFNSKASEASRAGKFSIKFSIKSDFFFMSMPKKSASTSFQSDKKTRKKLLVVSTTTDDRKTR